MKIGENLSDSFSFAHAALFGQWTRWIMLIIASFVFPVMYGYNVLIMRGIEPDYENESFFSLFINGIKLCVISIAYMIIPLIAFMGTLVYGGLNAVSLGGEFSMEMLFPVIWALVSGLIITSVLGFIFLLLSVVASVRFARTGSMGEAFALGEIITTIGRIGWLKYIFSLIALFIVVAIIMFAVVIIEMILGLIPILGFIIGFIINLFIGPYISIMTSRYYSLLYDEAV
jgi:hypothetical protein